MRFLVVLRPTLPALLGFVVASGHFLVTKPALATPPPPNGGAAIWLDCNSATISESQGPAPLPVTATASGNTQFKVTSATGTAAESKAVSAVVSAHMEPGHAGVAFGCAGASWEVDDLIFHTATGTGGTANIQVNGRVVATTTGGNTGGGCGATTFASFSWGGSPVAVYNTVIASPPDGTYDVPYTSPAVVAVPLDTPITFSWGLSGRQGGNTGCNNGYSTAKTIDVQATAGDVAGDIFAVTGVNANDGGGVVDITSTQAGIGGGSFLPETPSVPALPAVGLVALSGLLLGTGCFAMRRRLLD